MSIVTQVETITPVVARAYLAQNIDNNRTTNDRIIALYAIQMQNGEWRFNGDPIRFDHTGSLIDGQHRLAAIIKANVSIKCVVVSGLPSNAVETIDIGRKRSVADALKMQYGVSSGKHKASIAKALHLPYQDRAPFSLSSCHNSSLSTHQIITTYLRHQEAIDFVVQNRTNVNPPNAAVSSVITRAYYHENHQKIERFMSLLGTVTDCDEWESAALRLRDYLLDIRLKGVFGSVLAWESFKVAQSTLKAFLQGRKMTRRIIPLKNGNVRADVGLTSPRREIEWLIPGFDDQYVKEWESKNKKSL